MSAPKTNYKYDAPTKDVSAVEYLQDFMIKNGFDGPIFQQDDKNLNETIGKSIVRTTKDEQAEVLKQWTEIYFNKREREVLKLVSKKAISEIPKELNCSMNIVRTVFNEIYKKTNKLVCYQTYNCKLDELQMFMKKYGINPEEIGLLNKKVKSEFILENKSNVSIQSLDEELARLLCVKEDLKRQLQHVDNLLSGIDYVRNFLASNGKEKDFNPQI